MASPRDDLRDHLMAVLAAAPELPREDREHLADVFLRELNSQYRLVPRTQNASRLDGLAGTLPQLPEMLRGVWPMVAIGVGLLLLLPVLLILLFILAHAPFLVLFILLLFFVRFRRHRMWRGPMMRR